MSDYYSREQFPGEEIEVHTEDGYLLGNQSLSLRDYSLRNGVLLHCVPRGTRGQLTSRLNRRLLALFFSSWPYLLMVASVALCAYGWNNSRWCENESRAVLVAAAIAFSFALMHIFMMLGQNGSAHARRTRPPPTSSPPQQQQRQSKEPRNRHENSEVAGANPSHRRHWREGKSGRRCEDDNGRFRLRVKVGEREIQAHMAPTESLGDLKRIYFPNEVESGARIRMFRSGFQLQDDTRSLADMEITADTVLHVSVGRVSTASVSQQQPLAESEGSSIVLRFGDHLLSVLLTALAAAWWLYIHTEGRAYTAVTLAALSCTTGVALHAIFVGLLK